MKHSLSKLTSLSTCSSECQTEALFKLLAGMLNASNKSYALSTVISIKLHAIDKNVLQVGVLDIVCDSLSTRTFHTALNKGNSTAA